MSIIRYLPRFRAAYRSFDELEAREQWPRTRIEALQLDRINELWGHARQFVPYYRRLNAERKLPARFASLEEYTTLVPPLPRVLVRQRSGEFLSERPRPGSWHCTSGSSGTPLRSFRDYESHHEMLRTNYRYYRMWGHDIFDPTVFLWRSSRASGFSGMRKWLKELCQDKLRNRMRLSALTLGKDDLRRYLDKMTKFQPSALYSYSHAAYLLAREAMEQGVRFPSLKVVNLTSEPVPPHVVRLVEEALGVPCIDQYGCVEVGFVAGEWPDRTLRVREDIMFVETTPREHSGYNLLLTSLNNPSFPLLRYDIGDVTDRPLERPEQGFAILGKISGRDDDVLYTPSGRCLHPFVVDTVFEQTYYEHIRRYQVQQREDRSLLALVELHEPQMTLDTEELAEQLSLKVEGCPAEVRIVEQIPPSASGKHRTVISAIKEPGRIREPQATA